MILVHRLNGQPFVVNALHIVSIERTPDTLLTLFGGAKLLVADDLETLVQRCEDFVRHIGSAAVSAPSAKQDT
jgi:flagellar protein FlbD